MSRLIFGWSYPPGCSGPPEDYQGPCEVCGKDTDNCICPECPTCQSYGDPACYEKHGLVRTQEQIEGRKIYDECLAEEAKAEEAILALLEKGGDELTGPMPKRKKGTPILPEKEIKIKTTTLKFEVKIEVKGLPSTEAVKRHIQNAVRQWGYSYQKDHMLCPDNIKVMVKRIKGE